MKRFPLACLALILFCIHPLAVHAAAVSPKAARPFTATEPEIAAIRERIVKVRVPAGYERVTLQVLNPPRHRLRRSSSDTGGQWQTVGVNYPRKIGATIDFRLDRLTPRRLLRVFGTRMEILPGSLLTGITSFLPESDALSIPVIGNLLAPLSDAPAFASANALSAANASGTPAVVAVETRTVAEADIWKLEGDRLYFFNERRGLQVFDLSKPDSPALLGALRMPAMGEDMYLLDAAHVVLLKKSWNWYWSSGGDLLTAFDSAVGAETLPLSADSAVIRAAQFTIAPQRDANKSREIVIADVRDGQPRVVGSVAFEGTVRESRMVGKVLYLATDTYRPVTVGGQPQWGLAVTSFDLHDPAHPVRRASIHLGGWANAVTANDRTLLIAKWGAKGGTDIDILDISDPNGAMTRGGSVSVVGSVADKFKLREAGGVLTVVSQKWRERTRKEIDDLLNLPANVRPPDFVRASQVGITAVNTFSLADPAAPVPLGTLDLALDETLHATRFDGDRLYVITAQHRPWIHITYIWDPLWIVDLADPAKPAVLGELEMPGLSTYIEPLGDRLVTIGLVDARPTVSLFDISNAAKPTELSRIVLTAGQWTNREAVWNEKAFAVLPDENLILMPLSGWNGGTGSTAGVQLLDLHRDEIVKRGLLVQPFAPRRATVHRGRIIAISPETLLTIDATNRDAPRVSADVEIAWNVDRVFAIGSHVVQLGSQWKPDNSSDVTLTVTPANNPDETLRTLTLNGPPLVDATLRDGVLYLVQMKPGESSWDSYAGVYHEILPDRVTLSAVDVALLPRIVLRGSVNTEVPHSVPTGYGWSARPRSLWLNETTLGFSIAGGGGSFLVPFWNDPAPYDTHSSTWIPNPDAPSVDAAAIDAGSVADVIVTQIYIGKSAGHWEHTKTGTIDPPGYWSPSNVWRNTQRIFAFDVRNPAQPRFASYVEIGNDQPWDVDSPVAVDGALFASYRHLGSPVSSKVFAAANTSDPNAFARPEITRQGRHFLQSVDYSNPMRPVLSPDHPNLPGHLIGTAPGGAILFTTGRHYDAATGAIDGYQSVLHASALDGDVVHLLDQLPLTQPNRQPSLLRGRTVFQFQMQPAKIWVPSNEPPPVRDPILDDEITLSGTLSLPGFIAVQSGALFTSHPYFHWNPGTYEDNPRKSTLTTWELRADGKFAQLDEIALAHESTFHLFGNLGVTYERENQPRFLDLTDPANIQVLGFRSFAGAPYLNYPFADGAVGSGLWVPAGHYGLEAILFPK